MNTVQSFAAGEAQINPQLASVPTGAPVLNPSWRGCKLLWVDDSKPLLSLYKAIFEKLGFEVQATASPADALERLATETPDVAILDYDMPEMDGGTLASLMKDHYPSVRVILHSGNSCIPGSVSSRVDAICAKASPREELLATIEQLSYQGWRA
jgi:CheY-like chemotaxis protein